MISFHYKVFTEVATNLSFSKAANALFITQPAVSKHIKKLEAEIGLPLFVRKGNSISLTTSGEKLLEYLHKAKIIQGQIESDIQIVKNQLMARGELNIGASTTLSLYVLPKILSSFHKKYPNINILLVNRNTENILNALLNKEIDLAIIEDHNKINSVSYQAFMADEIIPVCTTHSPYGKDEIEPEELLNIPLVIRERGSGTLAVMSKKLAEKNIRLGKLNIIARLGGTEALKNFLLEDIAIGFLSRLAVKSELDNGSLREVKIQSIKIERKFNFLRRKGEESTGIIKSFIKEAKASV